MKFHPRTGLVDPEVRFHSFFNLSDRWSWWSTPLPGCLTPGKYSPNPLYRRLGGNGKSPPTEIRSPDHPTRSESLYRLRHCGTQTPLLQYLSLRQGQMSKCGLLQKCRTLGCRDTWRLIIPVNLLHRPLCDSWKNHATQLRYNQHEPPVCVSTDCPMLLDHVPSPLQGTLLFSDARPGSSDISRILLLLWCCTDVCIHLAE
jgi:hypothetical protein